MKNFDEFRAAALRVPHITDVMIEVKDGREYLWVEAYLSNADGSHVEKGYGVVDYGEAGVLGSTGKWATPGEWLLGPFERSIADDQWQGYTRYATADEIETYRSQKKSCLAQISCQLQQLAQQQGMRASQIHDDKGIPAVLIETVDDMGDYLEDQERAKTLAHGRLQAAAPRK